ncbi:hypothetical protein TEQG_07160 [Trichophyton equinum CBS 127.97]|uniref:Uncharacterized protein n=1 Tax=Trichophyton equinum (strain ATCC MYA-4606 / CBS 127.97) TaxID=559882 RepID=F2Q265_TRIEC|nr:hypothetical protein TEQG_07160 [Trichophyton equinum CBS 127.97]
MPCVPGGTRGTCGDCRQASRRCEPLNEILDICYFIHLRMAIFGLRGAGWSVAPAMITELKGLYNKIMEPVWEMRSEAAQVGGIARARRPQNNAEFAAFFEQNALLWSGCETIEEVEGLEQEDARLRQINWYRGLVFSDD